MDVRWIGNNGGRKLCSCWKTGCRVQLSPRSLVSPIELCATGGAGMLTMERRAWPTGRAPAKRVNSPRVNAKIFGSGSSKEPCRKGSTLTCGHVHGFRPSSFGVSVLNIMWTPFPTSSSRWVSRARSRSFGRSSGTKARSPLGLPKTGRGLKKVTRRQARLVFVDESGVTFTPLVQRTWALRGHTPVLKHRLRSWKKVSLIGVWSTTRRRRIVDWSCQLVPGRSLVTDDFIALLRSLLRRWRGKIVLLWDRLPGHRSATVQRYIARHPRLDIEYLPPYAPELNPNEYAWGYLKRNLLPQFCPDDLDQLHAETWFQTLRLSGRDQLIRSFFNATKLPFRWSS